MANPDKLCDRTACTGCGACLESCKFHAIDMVQDPEGFRYPEIAPSLCKSCGACSKSCHILNPPEKHQIQTPVYAIWAKDDKFRLNSASGGAASVFGDYVFSQGGLVTGVVFDKEFCAVMKLMETADEIQKSRSSKYVEVLLDGVFCDILQRLKEDKNVLFIGLPCHVAAVKTFIPKEHQQNLITVELICHGVPSLKAWNFYFNQQRKKFPGKVVTDFLFRQVKSWNMGTVFYFSDGGSVNLKRASYISAFMKGYMFRESCFHCPYAAKDRVGDLTIGDFWMYPAPRNGGGVSYLSINSEKGKAFFESVRDRFDVRADKWENAVKYNGNLAHPSHRIKGRETFYHDFYSLTEEEVIRKYHLYRNLLEKILSIPQRVIRKIESYLR